MIILGKVRPPKLIHRYRSLLKLPAPVLH